MNSEVDVSQINGLLSEFLKDNAVNAYAWLWQNSDLSDVTINFSCTLSISVPATEAPVSVAPTDIPGSSPACAEPTVDIIEQLVRRVFDRAQEAHAQQPATRDPVGTEQVFPVHAAVLCSNSAYFRARITSGVGAPIPHVGGKRSRRDTLTEVMQADECGAAVAVLRYFYLMQLKLEGRDSCSAEFLLQMMKVRKFPSEVPRHALIQGGYSRQAG